MNMQVVSQKGASRASSGLFKAFSAHAVARTAVGSPVVLPRLGSPLVQHMLARRSVLQLPRQQRVALCTAAATETPEETYTYQAEVGIGGRCAAAEARGRTAGSF
jgi:hypothetical protein